MIVVINKPLYISSFKAVEEFKIQNNFKKVGHCGTLDPLATGVLVVATDEDTKKIKYIQEEAKTYKATFIFGSHTKSYDAEFDPEEIIDTNDLELKSLENLIETSFKGEIMQHTPAFSAIKIKGVKSHKIARKGGKILNLPRFVSIYDFKIISFKKVKFDDILKKHAKQSKKSFTEIIKNYSNQDLEKIMTEVEVEIKCSKGTYIRSIAQEIGEKLKIGGYVLYLKRTAVGNYTEKDCINLFNLP